MPHFLPRLIDAAVYYRWWLLAAAIVGAACAWGSASRLSYDRSIENLFARDDPLVATFAKLKRVFGQHEIVMLVYEDRELFAPAGEGRLRSIAERVRRTPGVASILSLATVPGLATSSGEGRTAALRLLFERYTHGPDGKTAAIVTMLDPPEASPLPRPELLGRLREIADGLPHGSVIGEPVLIDESFTLLQADSRRLLTWSAALLAATMLVTLRSLRWVLGALAVVAFTVIATRAFVSLAGMRLSLVSTMLPAVITVIGVATVMHVAVRQRQEVGNGRSAGVALRGAIVWLWAPIGWSCATDAAGFASLLVSSVEPVSDFGVMMVIGSLLVLPAVLLIVPAIALAFAARSGDPRGNAPPKRRVGSSATPAVRQVSPAGRTSEGEVLSWRLRRRSLVSVSVLAAVTILALVGSTRLQVETDFTENFQANSPVVEAYQFVENRLGGAGVWDVILPAPARLDAAYLARVRRLEQRLQTAVAHLDPPLKTLSLADAVDAMAGSAAQSDLVATATLATMKRIMPHFYAALYGADPDHPERHYLRVMLRAPERLRADQKLAAIAAVRRAAREAFADAEVTGYYVLLANLVTSLNRDQWVSLATAAAGIFLMVAIAFRSAGLAAAAVAVNALPVLVVFGAMGWLGIRLNMGGAMSAAVSLGLAVDASIHLITAYRRARQDGLAGEDAVRSALGTVGRPVFLATAALVVGLLALCGSEFVPTVHFGVLVGATMVGGLAGNLVLLPATLTRLEHGKG